MKGFELFDAAPHYFNDQTKQVCNINSPAGAGGQGGFRQAGVLCASKLRIAGLPHPNSYAGRTLHQGQIDECLDSAQVREKAKQLFDVFREADMEARQSRKKATSKEIISKVPFEEVATAASDLNSGVDKVKGALLSSIHAEKILRKARDLTGNNELKRATSEIKKLNAKLLPYKFVQRIERICKPINLILTPAEIISRSEVFYENRSMHNALELSRSLLKLHPAAARAMDAEEAIMRVLLPPVLDWYYE